MNAKSVGIPGDLPEPVRQYFDRVLAESHRSIRLARMRQVGRLRTDVHRRRWLDFRASHVVDPSSRSYDWNARVRMLPLVSLHVHDAYSGGIGSGRVRLLRALTVGTDSDRPELNAAALHRYLAEAVWYPTALLPSAGVQWHPIDSRSALATLSDCGTTVSLVFRFNDAAEVVGVYTDGRWRRTVTGYALTPWEGRFSGYRVQQGVRVPSRGEVGWYVNGRLEIVWIGEIAALEYDFERM